jgi:hypothetical protein
MHVRSNVIYFAYPQDNCYPATAQAREHMSAAHTERRPAMLNCLSILYNNSAAVAC